MKQDTYLDIVRDLVRYIEQENIKLPVILIIDGATCHVSLEMVLLCREERIEPILLRPNTTHLTQALDLRFFASLKAGLKEAQELWHRDPVNIGSSLSKYSVVGLVHSVTEKILRDKPGLIAKGFRKAGIVPWNPLAPTSDRMAPSTVYDRTGEQDQEEKLWKRTEEGEGNSRATEAGQSTKSGNGEYVVGERSPEEIAVDEKDMESVVQAPAGTCRKTISSVPLQAATTWFLNRFEVLLSKEETEFCRTQWVSGEPVHHPIYKAWETLKQSSLSAEELRVHEEGLSMKEQLVRERLQACEVDQTRELLQEREEQAASEVLAEHTPKNITPVKRKGGAKVPEGASRFLPTSPGYIDILEERNAKKTEEWGSEAEKEKVKLMLCK